ncbi:hypothetical protein ABPG74_009632 [Tetrahymena malaccensis]
MDSQPLQPLVNKYIITIICGLPASGKSTISSLISQNFIKKCIYIDIDQIEKQIHEVFIQNGIMGEDSIINQSLLENQDHIFTNLLNNIISQLECHKKLKISQELRKFDPQIWKFSRNLSLKVVETFIKKSKQSTSQFIIVEDVFNLRSMRKNYLHIAQSYQTGFCEVLIKMPIEEILLNDSLREDFKKVGESVILKSQEQFDYEPTHKDHFLLFENSNKTKLEESVQRLALQIQEVGSKIAQQIKELSEEEYQLLLQQHKESIADQLNLKLNETVGHIIKNSNYDIKSNGGGEGLSILKKLFFKIAKFYFQQVQNTLKQNIMESSEELSGLDELLKKYQQKFKAKKNSKEFSEVVQMIDKQLKGIDFQAIRQEQGQQYSELETQTENHKQIDLQKQQFIQQAVQKSSSAFEEFVKEFYKN